MKLLILGATGGTGRQLVEQAIAAGHDVTALARNAATGLKPHERLRVISGSVTGDPSGLDRAMQDQDAVISALGRGRSFKSTSLIQRSVPPILAGMKARGVRRLIFTSAVGVGDTVYDVPLFPTLFSRTFLRDIYADKSAGEALIRHSDLDWTLVQPVQLTDGPLTGTYRAGERLVLRGMPTISRADTAHFILSQLGDTTYVRKVVLLAY